MLGIVPSGLKFQLHCCHELASALLQQRCRSQDQQRIGGVGSGRHMQRALSRAVLLHGGAWLCAVIPNVRAFADSAEHRPHQKLV